MSNNTRNCSITDIKHVFAQNPLILSFVLVGRVTPCAPRTDGNGVPSLAILIEFEETPVTIGHDGHGLPMTRGPRHQALIPAFRWPRGHNERRVHRIHRDNGTGGRSSASLGWMTVNEHAGKPPLYWANEMELGGISHVGFRPSMKPSR